MVETILLNFVKKAGYVFTPDEEDLLTDEDVAAVNQTMEIVKSEVVKETLVGLKFGSFLVKTEIPVGKGLGYEVVCDCGHDDMFSREELVNGKCKCSKCSKVEDKPQWLIDEQNAYIEKLNKEREVKPIVEVVGEVE